MEANLSIKDYYEITDSIKKVEGQTNEWGSENWAMNVMEREREREWENENCQNIF